MSDNIRNFCIIAHIDHGKSTLADRLLEFTHTIEQRKMKEQLLDTMDLERERGITIKLQPVRMTHKPEKNINFEFSASSFGFSNSEFILNLIDTPGHVDFTYEVSRSLAAVESALLLVDATQGIQAQTLANYHLAQEQGLTIIPVINKIDLPSARIQETEQELIDLLNCSATDIIHVSGKTGQGIDQLLKTIVEKIPPPPTSRHQLQALIFDSVYNDYKGVVAYVRIFSGEVKVGDKIHFIGTNKTSEVLEVGYFKPQLVKGSLLKTGEIGYLVSGIKDLSSCRVGDTIINYTQINEQKNLTLPGYKQIKPMVFAGFFCKEGVEYSDLREGLEKIKLTDASLFFEPEHSPALGPGFRCGFLGLLHMEIIQERLNREHNLDLIVTTPSVAYQIKTKKNDNNYFIIHSPQELPNPGEILEILEPWIKINIITPKDYLGNLMSLIIEKRGVYLTTDYFFHDSERIILVYEMPLSSVLTDFYDKLKSCSSGYASLNYELIGYRHCHVERLDIVVAEERVDALATIVYDDEANRVGRKIVESLKKVLPRALFEIKIQAVLGYQDQGPNKGGKIIASERIPAMRKDVTGYLYGGDVTRKRKLLEKQKKGKKKMRALGKGRVDIPTTAYLSVLKK